MSDSDERDTDVKKLELERGHLQFRLDNPVFTPGGFGKTAAGVGLLGGAWGVITHTDPRTSPAGEALEIGETQLWQQIQEDEESQGEPLQGVREYTIQIDHDAAAQLSQSYMGTMNKVTTGILMIAFAFAAAGIALKRSRVKAHQRLDQMKSRLDELQPAAPV